MSQTKTIICYGLLPFAVAVSAAIFFAKRKERQNESGLMQNGEKSAAKDPFNLYISIAQPVGSAPWLWIFATFIWLHGKLKNYDLFYFYIYFYAMGFLPFAYSLLGYCKLGRKGLILFYGTFFNRKSLFLSWKDVEKVYISTYPKSRVVYLGARVKIAHEVTQEFTGLAIKLRNGLPRAICQSIQTRRNCLLSRNEIDYDCEKAEIIVKSPPEIGFQKLMLKLRPYAKVDTKPFADKIPVNPIYYSEYILPFFIFGLIVLGLLMMK